MSRVWLRPNLDYRALLRVQRMSATLTPALMEGSDMTDIYTPTNGDIVEFNHDTRLGYGVTFAAGTERTYSHDTDDGHVVIVDCPTWQYGQVAFSNVPVTVMFDDGITLVESA